MKPFYDPELMGTEGYTRFRMIGTRPLFLYTDSIAQHSEKFGGYWMLDVIGSYWPKLEKWNAEHDNGFMAFYFTVNDDGSCDFAARTDAGEEPLIEQHIEWTDLPHSIKWFWNAGGPEGLGVLMFPSDY